MRTFALLTLATLLIVACGDQSDTPPANKSEEPNVVQQTDALTPPDAPARPETLEIHGYTLEDPYAWLRDDTRTDPEVLQYLEDENAYTEAKLKHTESLQEELYEEIVGRIKQDDASVPVRIDDYWYYNRYEEGLEYAIHARKKGSLDAAEEIVIDENKRAEGHDYYALANYEPDDSHRYVAMAEDIVSRRLYTVRILDTQSGALLEDEIINTSGALAWSADGQFLFYVEKDPETLRPYLVKRHKVGTQSDEDVVVFEEDDNTYYTSVYRGKSGDYVYIQSGSTTTDEVLALDAATPEASFAPVIPRERGHEYSVDDVNGRLFVTTNDAAQNFRIVETTIAKAADKSTWQEVVPHREDVFIHGTDVSKEFLVVSERENGLRKLRVMPFDERDEFFIESDEAAYAMYLDNNPEIDNPVLRYGYTSMTTPYTIYDYDTRTGEKTQRKQQPVLGDFNSEDYGTERITITARDGTEVPVSLVYKKPFKADGSRPLLVYGYGAYGASMDPTFNISRLSLLDRDFVWAIAHIRGGQEMGRQWYEDGKMFNKMNTFTDFIDVSEGLVKAWYGNEDKVYAYGGSAGGLLVGAVMNLAPQVYDGIVAAVPFVDVINTMLDESIPLTTGEFDEWGNPKIKEQFDYIRTYSPYDQVSAQDYPNLLVTTGLHDSQVQYFEPAKWVAKLRDVKTDDNALLMYTDMESGHGGASGRFKRHEQTALRWAFLIDLAQRDEE